MNNHELAKKIVDLLGGKENISQAFHCVTRLRFYVYDSSKVQLEEIGKLDGVMRAQVKEGQYQVVIGPNVGEVFAEVEDVIGPQSGDKQSSNTEQAEKKPFKLKSLFPQLMDLLSAIFIPFLPALVAAGMLKGISAILVSFNILAATDGTLQFLNIISDVPFYFMPLFLAISMAKRLKVSEHLALLVAGAMMYPTYVDLVGAKTNPLSFFGLTVPVFKYASSVFPIMLGVGLLAFVYKRIDKYTPKMLKIIVVPTLSILITVPITLIFLAPIGAYLGDGLSNSMMWLFTHYGPLMAFALGFFYPLLVMSGINQSYNPVTLHNLEATGSDYTLPISLTSNFSQAGAAFGVGLKSKNKESRAAAFAVSLSAIIGISEPAMYTLNLPRRRPFYCAMLASGVGSAFTWIFGARCFAYVMPGAFSLPNYISSTGNIHNLIAILVCIIGAFILSTALTMLFWKEKDQDVNTDLDSSGNVIKKGTTEAQLISPVEGKFIKLADVKDETFASGQMGQGFGVMPHDEHIYAPCNGTVTVVMSTKHAVMIKGDQGEEVLVHMGIDTVNLKGECFESFVTKGQRVKQGDLISKMDVSAIKEKGYDPTVITICTNSNTFSEINVTDHPSIEMNLAN